MKNYNEFFKGLYKNFNERNIEEVIAYMADDVKWANGMEGGFVYGHSGVRDYWTRQFSMISSNVTPVKIEQDGNIFTTQVKQVVHDMSGKLLIDAMVTHIFHLTVASAPSQIHPFSAISLLSSLIYLLPYIVSKTGYQTYHHQSTVTCTSLLPAGNQK
jgi:hypothetical protein